jgi:hypothetical protein
MNFVIFLHFSLFSLPKYYVVLSFILWIQFSHFSINYFFFCFYLLFIIIFFSIFLYYLVLFDFYIEFDHYFFDFFKTFLLIESCLEFHHSAFDFNLFLCQIWFLFFIVICFILDPFLSYYFLISSLNIIFFLFLLSSLGFSLNLITRITSFEG